MNKLLGILFAAVALAACSPQVLPLYMEMRQPSASGLTLVGKTAAVVYMDGSNQVDSLFDRHAASALARALEADYYGGEEVIGLSRIPTPDSVDVNLMHELVMETGGDVIFLLSSCLDQPAFSENMPVPGAMSIDSAYVCKADIPVNSLLFVYDSMGNDEVRRYRGNTTLRNSIYNNGMSTEDGLRVLAYHGVPVGADELGGRIAKRFLSEWSTESFSFYYYDDYSFENWFIPLQDASDGKMAQAIDGWARLAVNGSSAEKRACACFNVAQAFYLMQDYKLSARWLDQADRMEDLSQSPALRKRLALHLEK